MKIKVGLFENNNSFREMLERYIDGTDCYEVIVSTPTGDKMLADLDVEMPDIILMDIDTPVTGIETIVTIKKKCPSVNILILSENEDEDKIFEAILAGASGYVLKKSPPGKIIEVFHQIEEGGAYMTPFIVRKVISHFNIQHSNQEDYDLSLKEKRVLQCLVNGSSYKMIASECKISMGTVRFHINKIYKKLHINSKSEAVAKAINESILDRM